MRVALAGYAYARSIHAPFLRAAGAQVVLAATGDPARMAQAEADWPGVRVVPDLLAMLATAPALGVDLVVLATPTGLHAEHVRAVLDAGLPCVVDKPLACEAASAAALVATARTARVPLTVYQNRRYDEGPRALGALLAGGELGTVRRLEMRYERWRPEPRHRWREDSPWQAGGGVLLDLGSHVVDLAAQVLGPVTSVTAQVASVTTTADDDAVLFCRHAGGGVGGGAGGGVGDRGGDEVGGDADGSAGGATSVLWVSSVQPAPGPRLRAVGTRAAYVWDDFEDEGAYPDLRDAPGSSGWVVAGATRRPAPLPDRAADGAADFYRGVAAALKAGPAGPEGYAARQAAMPVDPEEAVHTLAVIDAARISSVERREVAVAAG